MTRRMLWLTVIVLSLAAGLALLIRSPAWVDGVTVLAFCLLAPGFALVALLEPAEPLVGLVVTLATGAPLWALIATLEAFSGVWAPRGTVLTVAVLMLLLGVTGLMTSVWREHRADSVERLPAN